MIRCRECRSELVEDAVKCKECDAFQDWRRHLTFSATVLALLVALVSVLTVAIPILVKAFQSPKSDLVVTPISLTSKNVTQKEALQLRGEGGLPEGELNINASGVFLELIVTNKGERAGAITGAEVQVHNPKGFVEGDRWFPLVILGEARPGARVVDPGKSIVVIAFFHNDPRGETRWCVDSTTRFPVRVTQLDSEGTTSVELLQPSLLCRWDVPSI
jgi:hypothetical protein